MNSSSKTKIFKDLLLLTVGFKMRLTLTQINYQSTILVAVTLCWIFRKGFMTLDLSAGSQLAVCFWLGQQSTQLSGKELNQLERFLRNDMKYGPALILYSLCLAGVLYCSLSLLYSLDIAGQSCDSSWICGWNYFLSYSTVA